MSCNSTVDDTIRRLRNEGFSFAKIKRIVGCGQDRISRAIAEPMGVCVAKRPGPKPKLGLEALNMVEESTLANGRETNGQLARRISETFGVTVSDVWVQRRRAQLHFTYRPPLKVQALSESQMAD